MGEKLILITRPQHDIVTEYLAHWSHNVILDAEAKGFKIKDLGNSDANRKSFETFLNSKSPSFIFLNGHGDYNLVCGHNNKPLLDKQNAKLTKNTVTYALSCKAGKELSRHCVKKGAKSFIGYEEDFGFVTDTSRECTPFEDSYANIFRNIACTVPTSLLKGNSALESVKKTKNAFMKAIQDLSRSDSKQEYKDLRFWLFWDMQNLVAVGDKDATIY